MSSQWARYNLPRYNGDIAYSRYIPMISPFYHHISRPGRSASVGPQVMSPCPVHAPGCGFFSVFNAGMLKYCPNIKRERYIQYIYICMYIYIYVDFLKWSNIKLPPTPWVSILKWSKFGWFGVLLFSEPPCMYIYIIYVYCRYIYICIIWSF